MDVGEWQLYLAEGEGGAEILSADYLRVLGQFPGRYSELSTDIRYVESVEPYLYLSGQHLWVLDVVEPSKLVVVGFYPHVESPIVVTEGYIYAIGDSQISVFEFSPPKTELHLTLVDENQQPLPFEAQLSLIGWAHTGALELSVENNRLTLPLDKARLQTQWPRYGYGYGWFFYYLYLKPEGHVPIQSEAIYPLGHDDHNYQSYSTTVQITFPDAELGLQTDTIGEMTLQARKPQSRTLQLVDDDRNPISDMQVLMYRYESSGNHCGSLQGGELLSKTTSDSHGKVAVPDGDIIYAFEFQEPESDIPYYKRPEYVLQNDEHFQRRLVTRLTETVTIVPFYQLQSQPLEMIVYQDGKIATGKTLYAFRVFCPCGACIDLIATTDEHGKISLDEFYPARWDMFWFVEDDTNKHSKKIWHKNLNDLVLTDTLEIDLAQP